MATGEPQPLCSVNGEQLAQMPLSDIPRSYPHRIIERFWDRGAAGPGRAHPAAGPFPRRG